MEGWEEKGCRNCSGPGWAGLREVEGGEWPTNVEMCAIWMIISSLESWGAVVFLLHRSCNVQCSLGKCRGGDTLSHGSIVC
jgi:hypothetical protein